MWGECNCVVVWAFFVIAFLWDWNKNISTCFLFNVTRKCFLWYLKQFMPYSLDISFTIQANQVPQIIELKIDVKTWRYQFFIIFQKYLMILFWSYGLRLLILLHSLLFLSTPKLFIRLLLFWKNMHTYHLLHLSVSHILGWDTKHLLAGFLPWRSWNYSNFPSFKKSTETSVTPNDVYVCLCVCVCVCVYIAFSYSYISFMQIRINKSLNICTF